MKSDEFDCIIDSLPEGIIKTDKEGVVDFMNEAACALLGIENGKALGGAFDDFISVIPLHDLLKGTVSSINQKHSNDNLSILINCVPLIASKQICGAMIFLRDITREDGLQTQLENIQNASTMMEAILNKSDVGFIYCDAFGNIQFINQIYETLLGINSKEALGKHITQYFPDSKLPEVIRTGKAEYASQYDFRGRQTLIVHRIPVMEKGRVVGIIAQCIFKDTSEVKLLADKLGLLETKVRHYKKELTSLLAAKYSFEEIIGDSEPIRRVKQLAQSFAVAEAPVLITGDTGTGKELFAHAIHMASNRKAGPFVCLNCAAIPEELLESELFGYIAGAFTGAHHKGKIGKIELAEGGTLFLDEIGDLSMSAQAKLLRVLEEKRVEKVGDVYPIAVDFRLIGATNKKLDKLLEEDKFRTDLFYRLNTMRLSLPELRQRGDDIVLLVRHFLRQMNRHTVKLSDFALNILNEFNWPGNVREFRSVIERALSLIGESDIIDVQHLPAYIVTKSQRIQKTAEFPFLSLKYSVAEHEAKAILTALRLSGGNKVMAAKLLGISRSILYTKMERYDITM
ncbi:MAG: sigma 54-interacting transcriptional regulator [Deltaproteobacteria bacterium]|nr:sigma 54-interacting transcriptional regulator [Deltaproteobacteria bacterium]